MFCALWIFRIFPAESLHNFQGRYDFYQNRGAASIYGYGGCRYHGPVVIFPEGQTFSPLETVEAFATDTTRKDGRMVLQKIYALTQFDSGAYKLPAQRIEVNGQGFMTDSSLVNVATVPVDTLAQKMYDIKPLMEVDRNRAELWWWILGILLGLAFIGGLMYWFVFRKKTVDRRRKGGPAARL